MTIAEKIKTIQDRASLLDIANGYGLKMHRQAFRMVGDCPFCKAESTFSINDKRGLFYCFSCSANGDIFDFVGRMEDKNFGEAIDTIMAKIETKDA